MIRSKEPFNREKFYQLIEEENWYELWVLIESTHSVNITEEELRIAFNLLPKNYQFRNLKNWGNRFSVDFVREFRDRFQYRIFDCVRPQRKSSKVMEEFHHYLPAEAGQEMDDNEFTDVLLYKHDLGYIKRFIRRLQYHRIFNYWGQRQKFNLPYEEIEYLKEHAEETVWRRVEL